MVNVEVKLGRSYNYDGNPGHVWAMKPSKVRCMCDIGPPMSLALCPHSCDTGINFSAIASRDPSALKTPTPRLALEMGSGLAPTSGAFGKAGDSLVWLER